MLKFDPEKDPRELLLGNTTLYVGDTFESEDRSGVFIVVRADVGVDEVSIIILPKRANPYVAKRSDIYGKWYRCNLTDDQGDWMRNTSIWIGFLILCVLVSFCSSGVWASLEAKDAVSTVLWCMTLVVITGIWRLHWELLFPRDN